MIARPFERPEDIRLMQALCAELWRRQNEHAPIHVGDVAWWLSQHLNKLAEVGVRLWLDGDRCVAWAWLDRGTLDVFTLPERLDLLDEAVGWADPQTVYATEAEPGKIARLAALGYSRGEGHVFNHMFRDLRGDLPAVSLPDGYRVRTVRGPEDLDARVAVHRIVWAPSRVVRESYLQVMQAWPYRPELDVVIEAPDGSFAAFCLAWLDPDNAVGLFEPVGTHPDHRRLGLGAAVCAAALHGLRDAGATRATVLSLYPSDAQQLYERVGFRVVTRHVPFGKKPAEAVV